MTKAEIQFVRSLHDKRGRTDEGLFIAEGEKLIAEIRSSHLRIRTLYTLDAAFEGEEVVRITPKEMERISTLKTPTKALAVVEIPHHTLSTRQLGERLVLALDEVQNPGNLGTIIRLADWFGITDILCSHDSADCFNPKVVQATMGAILRVRVHYVDLPLWLDKARQAAIPVYGTFLEGENLYQTDLTEHGIVVMGNEGRGISEAAAAAVSHKLLIPPYPAERRTTESLNVAMATGIICAEFRRRTLK